LGRYQYWLKTALSWDDSVQVYDELCAVVGQVTVILCSGDPGPSIKLVLVEDVVIQYAHKRPAGTEISTGERGSAEAVGAV